jgi:hypothetical protein
MSEISDLLRWLHQFAYDAARSPASKVEKAMSMSEVVYEALDIMSSWTPSQQRQTIDTLQSWLNTGEVADLSLPPGQGTEELLKPILQAILDKAPKELGMK